MRYFTRFIAALALICALSLTAKAEGEAAEKPEKPKVELQDLVLSGTVAAKEITKEKNGEQVTTTFYVLTTENGDVRLPIAKDVDYAAFVGQTVTVTGQGVVSTKVNKKTNEETKVTTLKKVTAVEAAGAIAE